MDDNVKEDDPPHGSRSRKLLWETLLNLPNGEIIRGVAPEAQLMFLRVFSDTKEAKFKISSYTKAVEDASN